MKLKNLLLTAIALASMAPVHAQELTKQEVADRLEKLEKQAAIIAALQQEVQTMKEEQKARDEGKILTERDAQRILINTATGMMFSVVLKFCAQKALAAGSYIAAGITQAGWNAITANVVL